MKVSLIMAVVSLSLLLFCMANVGVVSQPDSQGLKNSAQTSKKKKIPVDVIAVLVAVVLLLTAAIIRLLYLKRQKTNQIESHGSTPLVHDYARNYAKSPYAISSQVNYANSPQVNSPYAISIVQNYADLSIQNGVREGKLKFENRQFTYNDLTRITNSFRNNIGTGGFGNVYEGILEDGTKVAVKMRSNSSSQGVKEFLAEAQNLTRVHHRYLVSLLGYCLDGDCMALVYDYMQEGTLHDKLRDNGRPLTWKHRLRITYESALGLEYLHKVCDPPLIHRDVKTNNILLNANLEAKIGDFGLSRAFDEASSDVSTSINGTLGYLDPEYCSSCRLSEKSDVFSFGVVLLEIVTGKPPIIADPDGGHLKKWVSQKLSRGGIESIVDPLMQAQYDINSVRKVTELARKCTAPSSAQRPTMSAVVTELKESLDMEISTWATHHCNTSYANQQNYLRNDAYVRDVNQNSTLEMAYIEVMPAPDPMER